MKYTLVLLALLAIVASCASADVNFGAYAKSIGMGGSGLAIVDDPIVSGAVNPAAYAVKNPKLSFLWPSIDYRFQGTSLSELVDVSSKVRNTSGNNAIEIARQLGKQDTKIELDGGTGFSLGRLVVTVDGQANVDLVPSANYQSWAKNSSTVDWTGYVNAGTGAINLAGLQSDFYADVTGQLITSLPAVGYGWKPKGYNTLNLGVRVKSMHSSVRKQRVGVTSATNNGTAGSPDLALNFDSAPQPGQTELIQDSGIGMDFGVIYQSPDPKMQFSTALVVNNLLKPNLSAVRLDTMISAGAAVRMSRTLTVSADVANINGAYGEDAKIRAGAELRPVRWLALRAGYGDNNITYGFGIRGYDFAFSKHTPVVIGRLWKF